MKLTVTEGYTVLLEEVFSGILMQTKEGNQIGICMIDDTFEINVLPKGHKKMNWWHVNMETGIVEQETPDIKSIINDTVGTNSDQTGKE